MSALDSYFTIKKMVTADLTVKASKFIAHAAPSGNRESAENFIADISHKYHDATHHCFAYQIGVGDQAKFRFSDAGEPSGTAGRPILQVIESKNLTNVVVVVTRYFGGTKLGTGGLIRAYHAAALSALNGAEVVEHVPKTTLELRFPYALGNAVHQVLHKFSGQTLLSRFEIDSIYTVEIAAVNELEFVEELRNVCRDKIAIEKI
ncbi:MAG: YigZ family protein [bacterium]